MEGALEVTNNRGWQKEESWGNTVIDHEQRQVPYHIYVQDIANECAIFLSSLVGAADKDDGYDAAKKSAEPLQVFRLIPNRIICRGEWSDVVTISI